MNETAPAEYRDLKISVLGGASASMARAARLLRGSGHAGVQACYVGSLNPCRASSFQAPSCFCQTWRAPILVLVALPSSSDSER